MTSAQHSVHFRASEIPPESGLSKEEEQRREMEIKEYQHAVRNRRPSMLEEAEAFAASDASSNRASDEMNFLHPEHASMQAPSAAHASSKTTPRTGGSPGRSPDPEARRVSGQFSMPSHLEVLREGEKKGSRGISGRFS